VDQKAVADEIARRVRAEKQRRAVYETQAYYAAVKALLIKALHAEQQSIVQDIENGQRYISLCCSRRAGKTHLLATLIVILLLEAQFQQEIVFIAPTLKRGKELIWAEVEKIVDEYCLPWKKSENQGTIKTTAGGKFRIVGLDKQKEVDKVARGGNTKAFFADESQNYSHLLQRFVAAASPALLQTKGIIIASGTPGYAMTGYWYDICHGKEGFKGRHWTLFDNPYLGVDPHQALAEVRADKGWDETHPDYIREYLGRWTRDKNRLVFEFDPLIHEVAEVVPEYSETTRHEFRHILGIDYGFVDPTAYVVLAAHRNSKEAYVVHADKQAGLTPEEIYAETKRLKELYSCSAIVADSASGGSTFIADFNRRHGSKAGVRMRPARKHDRAGSIAMLNGELRTKRLVLVKGLSDPLATEMKALQYADDGRSKQAPGDDHCADAARYALNEFCNYGHKPKTDAITDAEKEAERWNQIQNQIVEEHQAA